MPWFIPSCRAACGSCGNLLVGGIPTPLKNLNSSVGMMKFPTEWKNNPNVPKHQPDLPMKQAIVLTKKYFPAIHASRNQHLQ